MAKGGELFHPLIPPLALHLDQGIREAGPLWRKQATFQLINALYYLLFSSRSVRSRNTHPKVSWIFMRWPFYPFSGGDCFPFIVWLL